LAEYSFKGHIGKWVDVFAHDIKFVTKVMILLDNASDFPQIIFKLIRIYEKVKSSEGQFAPLRI
jgi:hypothetical protein